MRGCDIFTAADAWLINSRNQDSNIPHHLAGSCTWAHTAHFRINSLSRRNFHFPLECSIVGFSYFHDPQKIHWQKHWELEECPAPAPALGLTSRRTKRQCHQSNDARGHRVIGWPHSRADAFFHLGRRGSYFNQEIVSLNSNINYYWLFRDNASVSGFQYYEFFITNYHLFKHIFNILDLWSNLT